LVGGFTANQPPLTYELIKNLSF